LKALDCGPNLGFPVRPNERVQKSDRKAEPSGFLENAAQEWNQLAGRWDGRSDWRSYDRRWRDGQCRLRQFTHQRQHSARLRQMIIGPAEKRLKIVEPDLLSAFRQHVRRSTQIRVRLRRSEKAPKLQNICGI
jgi:hypothetical protein